MPEQFTNGSASPSSICFSCEDTDNDGCTDKREFGPKKELGGLRDPENFWDFYDVWTRTDPFGNPTGWERNKVVDLFNDIFGVALRFGASRASGAPTKLDALTEALTAPAPDNKTGYHAAFDRSPPIDSNNIIVGSPDGMIDLFNDIFGVAFQFGHNCN